MKKSGHFHHRELLKSSRTLVLLYTMSAGFSFLRSFHVSLRIVSRICEAIVTTKTLIAIGLAIAAILLSLYPQSTSVPAGGTPSRRTSLSEVVLPRFLLQLVQVLADVVSQQRRLLFSLSSDCLLDYHPLLPTAKAFSLASVKRLSSIFFIVLFGI